SSEAAALWKAASDGRAEEVQKLIEDGADTEARAGWMERTALQCVCNSYGSETMVKILLAGGANTEAKDKAGKTPLHLSVEGQQELVVKMLLESKGAETSLVELLLEHGADVSAGRDTGETPLHAAASKGNAAAVAILLERGADASAQADNGKTPLHAIVNGGYAIVQAERQGGHNYVEPESDADEVDAAVVMQRD
ncbi:ankyrin repeat-containing domain protein, partial [Baffinella frigidus]